MNPARIAMTAIGTSAIVLLNPLAAPFTATVGVDVSQAVGATYSVQYTLDDVAGINTPQPGIGVANPLWRTDVMLPVGTTTSGQSVYQNPIMAVRLVLAALTSGTVQFEVLQGMNAGQQA